MIVFVVSGLFMGGLLGAHFSVLALIPAAGCTLGIAAIVSAEQAGVHDWSLLHIAALLVFSQIGYLCGAAVRLFVTPLRAVGEEKTLGSP